VKKAKSKAKKVRTALEKEDEEIKTDTKISKKELK